MIYHDDQDRQAYLEILGDVIEVTSWHCLSFCLMDNHVHLLLETPAANLGSGMRRLQSEYAQRFNARYQRSGHVFQGRYGAVRITSEAQLWATVAYIVRNPVEAGKCERAEQWPWSSHRAVELGEHPRWLATDRLLSHFDALGGDPKRLYRELTAGLGVATPRIDANLNGAAGRA